jgi:uncharacterized protein with FMN-binding domain
MKKLVVLLAAGLLATAAQAAYKDGVYQGEGQGNHGAISVEVTVKGGKVAAVKVLKHTETDMIIQAPIDYMLPEIVQKNGTAGVESVAGATNSSKGIKEGVDKALAQAK